MMALNSFDIPTFNIYVLSVMCHHYNFSMSQVGINRLLCCSLQRKQTFMLKLHFISRYEYTFEIRMVNFFFVCVNFKATLYEV